MSAIATSTPRPIRAYALLRAACSLVRNRVFLSSNRHLAESDVSYTEHFAVAMGISVRLLGASLASAVHAILPGVFTTAASSTCEAVVAEVTSRKK